MEQGRFVTAELSLNLAGILDQADCNPGGSTICTTGTKGCDAGLTCVGTSTSFGCQAASEDILDLGLKSRILVDRERLGALQKELQQVVARFAGEG